MELIFEETDTKQLLVSKITYITSVVVSAMKERNRVLGEQTTRQPSLAQGFSLRKRCLSRHLKEELAGQGL